ncbi:TRAP transporter TAXI family solute receptor [Rhizobium halophytocola]|uniref:TRAP transporter TAXI family solute receptor n=2 Tax=Rhizobium halophytocola TaxID=735519 RepID=A0ABS4DWN1_9HYPH|nr:TRAP transporter TAXI family solute receptor [Rhizobium halophytocola]
MASKPGGTHWPFAEDIAKLGKKCGLDLNLVQSGGSLENFFGVRNRHNTQFGIVAGDVLNYMNSYQSQNADVRSAVQGMRIMLPLYDAEVQVVARSGINSLADLAGRRVGVGPEDSAANLTGQLMFDILHVKPSELVKGSNDDMIELLRQGEIDALIRVAGAPVDALADGRLDERFHMVPITESVLKASYKPTTLKAGTYKFQPNAVETIAVKTVIMTYEYGSMKNAYYQKSCKTVADFTKLIVDNIDELRRTGHPKWKDIDLTEIPNGWEIGDCVRKGLDPNYEVQCTKAPADDSANQAYLDLLRKHLKE